jgi:hypothetical protein
MNWIAKSRALSSLLFIALIILIPGSNVRGQDSDDAKKQKERIEFLEARLKLAEKEIELLKKENELLKAQKPYVEKEGAKKLSLSDMLSEGKVLSGTYRYTNADAGGEMTLTIIKRDKTKIEATVLLVPRAGKDGKPPPVEYSVEGEITGIQLSLKSSGTAGTVNFTMSNKKTDALEGSWFSSSGSKGTVGLKIPK